MLVLMVRNESAILERCISTARPFVDEVLVADTGSEDATRDIARALGAKVVEDPWRNFGWNRTLSLEAAKTWAGELGWDLQKSYALVIDADMLLRGSPEALRVDLCDRSTSGAHLLQKNCYLEYANQRLMRLSDPWFCEGVTHEYWTGGGDSPLLCGAWIDDVGDGGCKSDKFERDERLLLEGLREKPECERYVFYLAQTYHCLNRHSEAAEWYLKRVQAGGWVEEVWYSHFMLTCTFLNLQKPIEAELWAQKALEIQSDRPEALLRLVTYFRERSDHFKAWHYLLEVEKMKKPEGARLFLDPSAYDRKPHYERTILHYYVKAEKVEGAMCCLSYQGEHEVNAMQNLAHYCEQFPAVRAVKLDFPAPSGYRSSSVGVSEDFTLAVRTVSYRIEANGSYALANDLVETRNFKSKWKPEERSWEGWEELEIDARCAAKWRRGDQIRGLEDVRICGDTFTATTREFSYCPANRVVHGKFPRMTFVPVQPPLETSCEKNWLPLGGNRVIYGWHPFTIGEVNKEHSPAELEIVQTFDTPSWFRHLRGSAPPFRVDDELWVLTHIVSPHAPRRYLHMWVVLDENLRPMSHSPPFYLHHQGIEYCCGARVWESSIHLFLSVWDRETWFIELCVQGIRRSLRPIDAR